jgi:glycine cleavage system regulatory protein
MTRSLVLTVLGADKPGLVEALSRTVTAHDGNWLESRMAHMAGRFAGIVRVRVPESAVEALQRSLASLEAEGLRVQCEPGSGEEQAARGPVWTLALVGPDHPGIVRDVAAALRQRRVNVEELSTACTSAPMSGEALFQATARLRLPAGGSVDDLRAELEQGAASLMVDVSLDEDS